MYYDTGIRDILTLFAHDGDYENYGAFLLVYDSTRNRMHLFWTFGPFKLHELNLGLRIIFVILNCLCLNKRRLVWMYRYGTVFFLSFHDTDGYGQYINSYYLSLSYLILSSLNFKLFLSNNATLARNTPTDPDIRHRSNFVTCTQHINNEKPRSKYSTLDSQREFLCFKPQTNKMHWKTYTGG